MSDNESQSDFEMELVDIPNIHDSLSKSQHDDEEDDNDDNLWEEVNLPLYNQPNDNNNRIINNTVVNNDNNIQITLSKSNDDNDNLMNKSSSRRPGPSPYERLIRLTCHKIHTIALIANAKYRNRLINDDLLHARMLSLLPLNYQLAFTSLTPSNIPDQLERSRKFDNALKRLMDWWKLNFDVDNDLKTILTSSFADVEEERKRSRKRNDNDNNYEIIRSSKSLQKRVLKFSGSRDLSSQLFTALCRALNVPARLVVSLQAVPYRQQSTTNNEINQYRYADISLDDSDDNLSHKKFMTWEERKKAGFKDDDNDFIKGEAASSANIAPRVKLKGRSKPKASKKDVFDINSPPVFWTEVFSRPDGKWIPVDPIRNKFRNQARNSMDPLTLFKYNKMTYVVAFEEDGYLKDVTPRYARNFGTKTRKLRPPISRNGEDWWQTVVDKFIRPFRLARDDVEDAEINQAQFSEPMPQSMQGFKDHPIYVLERHLKREEVVNPPTEVGRFKGEIVYPRANVQLLKTSENWLRQGRVVIEGEQPLKRVKQRAVTINKRRIQEAAIQEGHDNILQGLYSRSQTEIYKAPPVVDGKIPKNKFGNVDLYVPSMLPPGGVHLTQKGIGKIAKKLGVDYGEAVIGFEFRKKRANPIINGIVIDEVFKDTVIDAFDEWQSQQIEKEHERKLKDVYKLWQRVVQALRIRERVKGYKDQAQVNDNDNENKTEYQELKGDNDVEIQEYNPGEYEKSLDAITKAESTLPIRRFYEDTKDEEGNDENFEMVEDVEGIQNSDSNSNINKHEININVPSKRGPPTYNNSPKTMEDLIKNQENERRKSTKLVENQVSQNYLPEDKLRNKSSSKRQPSRQSKSASKLHQQPTSSGRVTRSRAAEQDPEKSLTFKRQQEAIKRALGSSDEDEDDYNDNKDVIDISSDD